MAHWPAHGAAYGSGYRPHMQYPLVESYLPGHQPRRDQAGEARATAEQQEVDDAD